MHMAQISQRLTDRQIIILARSRRSSRPPQIFAAMRYGTGPMQRGFNLEIAAAGPDNVGRIGWLMLSFDSAK
ncbi:MAG: hypothetical protein H6631_16490 [Anaerolineaceae bacterium]|nr:hypothetical protein [Anaerolineaceae bacterium]